MVVHRIRQVVQRLLQQSFNDATLQSRDPCVPIIGAVMGAMSGVGVGCQTILNTPTNRKGSVAQILSRDLMTLVGCGALGVPVGVIAASYYYIAAPMFVAWAWMPVIQAKTNIDE